MSAKVTSRRRYTPATRTLSVAKYSAQKSTSKPSVRSVKLLHRITGPASHQQSVVCPNTWPGALHVLGICWWETTSTQKRVDLSAITRFLYSSSFVPRLGSLWRGTRLSEVTRWSESGSKFCIDSSESHSDSRSGSRGGDLEHAVPGTCPPLLDDAPWYICPPSSVVRVLHPLLRPSRCRNAGTVRRHFSNLLSHHRWDAQDRELVCDP